MELDILMGLILLNFGPFHRNKDHHGKHVYSYFDDPVELSGNVLVRLLPRHYIYTQFRAFVC